MPLFFGDLTKNDLIICLMRAIPVPIFIINF